MRIYSHLERQLISYQVNAVLGAHNFSYLEGRVSYCSIEQKMYVRRLLLCTEYTGAHHWYRRRASGVPNEIRDVLVQETRSWCTKWNKRCVGTGNALLVYQMDKKMPLVQETRFWCTNKDRTSVSGQWKETVAEQ